MIQDQAQRRRGLTAAVVTALAVVTGVAVLEFQAVEDRLTSTWMALRPGDASVVDPASYENGRYGVYFALAEHGNGAEILISQRLRGNTPGRLLGIGRLSETTIVPFDEDLVASVALESNFEPLTGPFADGEAEYHLILADPDVETLIFARARNGDLVIADIRILPARLSEELRP